MKTRNNLRTNLSGLQSQHINNDSNKTMKKDKLTYLYLFVILLLHSLSLIVLINSSLNFSYDSIRLFFFSIIVIIIYLILIKIKVSFIVYHMITLGSIIMYCMICFGQVRNACIIINGRVVEIMNIVYSSDFNNVYYIYQSSAITLLYLLVIMISSYIVVLCVEYIGKMKYIILFDAFMITCFLFLHRVPNIVSLITLICCWFSIYIYINNCHQLPIQHSMQALLVISLLLGCVTNNAKDWINENKLVKKQKEVNDFLLNFHIFDVANWDFSGNVSTKNAGVSHGALRQAVEFNYTGQIDLYLTASEQVKAPIYLRGYGSSLYENSQWIDQYSNNSSVLFDTGLYSLFYQEDALNSLTIENLTGGNDVFTPYASIVNDEVLTKEYKQYGYEYSSNFNGYSMDELIDYLFGDLELDYQILSYSRRRNRFNDIEDFVNTFYRDDLEDITEIVTYITSILDDYSYTRKPGETPAYEDYVEYFLLKNKKGFCMHFASSATLLFQLFGVNSRYVEGYVAYPSDFVYNKELDLYEGYVRDYRAHAWAEIYVEDVGWIPIDMTPSSNENQENLEDLNPNSDNQEDEFLHSGLTTNDSNNQNNTEEQEEVDQNQNQVNVVDINDNHRKINYLLLMAILVLLLFIIQALIRRNILKRRLVEVSNHNVLTCYTLFMKLLALMNFEYQDLSIDHISIITFYETYGFKDEVIDFMNIIYRVRFSNPEISDEEYMRVVGFYKKFVKYTYSNIPRGKRFLLYFAYCM